MSSPRVVYEYGSPTVLYHWLDDREETPVEIHLEHLDAIRVCRGEFSPYEDAEPESETFHRVSYIENSGWLQERYEYESEHYGSSYEWGGEVHEMLTDFEHYLFEFHDEFVEAIAKGFWIQLRHRRNPLDGFERGDAVISERTIGRAPYAVRAYPSTLAEIAENARFCTQPVYQFSSPHGPELEVCVRSRRGRLFWLIRPGFAGNSVQGEGIPDIAQAWDAVQEYLDERYG